MAIQTARQCEGISAYGQRCRRQLPPQDGPGRARRYCGDTCRSSARRDREARALSRLPHCSWPSCAKRATKQVTLSNARSYETCEEHEHHFVLMTVMLGKEHATYEREYDLDGLKRAELLRDEKHRMGIELQGQVTVDQLLEEDVDEDEALELVDATEEADRDRQRQELVGDTGNVPAALRSSRCRNRHHEDCDGHRRHRGISQGLCLCTCH